MVTYNMQCKRSGIPGEVSMCSQNSKWDSYASFISVWLESRWRERKPFIPSCQRW